VQLDCDCTHHVTKPGPPSSILGLNNGGCRTNDSWATGPPPTACGNSLVLKCDGFVHLVVNGSDCGLCTYTNSDWDNEYWTCKCGAEIMKTHFWVIDTGPSSPTYGQRIDSYWTCTIPCTNIISQVR
jgi:hypothetical protein